ncbi:conserved hypothetical protein [Phenylobacterium zucineum HLK1]|uniref:Peptidase S9 prolyl oligopeptidase catalytic domain-containing protein n=1 Tax=Phenylobacterium zucineum (strain HLK1) TaxID=450851 RepID=B4REQ9_PHEZH|nr:prolyl oligopeptidase family serine peptidase [Phenylobacterium zucineum]ACG78585.1 conserved hypothetical protein [Phenylobacterium zucineum HLK1]
MLRRMLRAALAAGLALCAGAAAARPFTVEDLLAQESFGAAAFDPTGRWLVFEQRDPYRSADRFDLDKRTSQSLGRLRIVDLAAADAPPRSPSGDPRGLALGAFAPGGAHAAVYRLDGRAWRLGILTLATGEVRWLDLTPEADARGPVLAWLSDAAFLVIVRSDGEPPRPIRSVGVRAARLPSAWAATASGAGAHTVLGSGRHLGVRARAAPRLLLAIDARTGSARSLAEGEFFALALAPDRRRVALLASGEDLALRADRPARGPAGNETEATHLTLLDLATGRTLRPCPDCDLLPQLLAWSPDSRALLAVARGADGLWTSGRLQRIDARTGAVAPACPGVAPTFTLNPAAAQAGWLGTAPLVFGRPAGSAAEILPDWRLCGPAGGRSLTAGVPGPAAEVVAVGRKAVVALSGGRLWTVDGAGRARLVAPLAAAGPVRPIRRERGQALPEAAIVAQTTEAGRSLWRVSADAVAPLGSLLGVEGEILAASAEARAVLRRRAEVSGVERLVLARGADRRELAVINRAVADTDPPEVTAVRHRGLGGEPLTSWLLLPERPAGSLPPLLIRPYLGQTFPVPPRDPPLERGFVQNLRVLTGRGYAVLVPSLPAREDGEPAQGLAERLLEIVAAAAATPAAAGRFDPERLGLVGFSNGGYSVLAAVTQSTRFHAAATFAGPSDMAAAWSTYAEGQVLLPEDGYMTAWAAGLIERTQNSMFAPPWRDPARYTRNSPLYAASRIETPVLLFHGSEDALPLAQSTAVFSALFRQGKDAQLVVYWGEGHGLASPGNVRDYYARLFTFLDAHLKTPARAGPVTRREPAAATPGPTPPPPSPTGSTPAARPR